MKILTFPTGIKLGLPSNSCENTPLKEINTPQKVVIPLYQHSGIQARLLVEKNNYVFCGQKIAVLEQRPLPAYIHSSVSGIVKDICPWNHPFVNEPVTSILIESDGKDNTFEIKKNYKEYFRYLPEEIAKVLYEAGVWALDHETFQKNDTFYPSKEKDVDTIILNACESEPYLDSSDDMLLRQYPREVVDGLKILMFIFNANNGLIAIQDSKQKAIEALQKVAFTAPNISIKVLNTKYPQGDEKQLIKTITKRTVLKGMPARDAGVVVSKIFTGYAVAQAIMKGEPLTKRIVTVAGKYISNPGNYLVRIGTMISDLLNYCGYSPQNMHKVIAGGTMAGVAQYNLNVPITKTTRAVIILSEEKNQKDKTPCIKCGKCVEVCPMKLLPLYLCSYAEKELWDKLTGYNIDQCIECGCCSYICPSKRPLVQAIRLGKEIHK